MDNTELRKLLHQLHDEIKSIRSVDEKSSEMLRDLERDIRAILERSEETPVQLHPSIVQRLEGALNHFEATHPDLTTLISKLLDSLSNAGI
jgi:predicted  nucleic acid-binding Zn-ribbon protein